MKNIKAVIISPYASINIGISSIMSKIRGITVVGTGENIEDISQNINSIDLIIITDDYFQGSKELIELYKINKNLIWGLFIKEGSNINPLYDFVLKINIIDSERTIIDKINAVVDKLNTSDSNDETSTELSEREKEILKNVAIGLTNNEIADKLFISHHTVISHRKNITSKLGIKTISGLTVYALLNNIIKTDDLDSLK